MTFQMCPLVGGGIFNGIFNYCLRNPVPCVCLITLMFKNVIIQTHTKKTLNKNLKNQEKNYIQKIQKHGFGQESMEFCII